MAKQDPFGTPNIALAKVRVEDPAANRFQDQLLGALNPRLRDLAAQSNVVPQIDKASLPEASRSMREGITLEHLRALAVALTDLQAGEELNEARLALFRRVPARTG